jgi:hypothetical protein
MPNQFSAALTTFLLASMIAAQRPVVTVGGPSPDYADLPQAVAAAAPGSIVEVWPGAYTGFTSQKALRIVLYGATVSPPLGSNYAIRVQNVVGADPFVIKGFGSQILSGAIGAMRVSNTLAPIIVESVTMVGGPFQVALDVFNTGAVHIARSILVGSPGLQAQFANLLCNENVIGNGLGAGAVVSDASLDSSRTIYTGNGQPGLRVFDSVVRLASDGTGGMLVLGAPVVPVSAFEAFDSAIYWQPSQFLLSPANGAPAFQSQVSTQQLEEVPMLNAGPAPMGGVATVRMTMASPALGMIAIGQLRPTPIVLGAIGIYTDPQSYVLAASGVVDQSGLIIQYTVPNNPLLRGGVYCFQGITFLANGSSPVSGPALWYVE